MSTPVQRKPPALKRPICIREMSPLVPGAMIDLEQSLSLLIAHLNEAPLVAAAAAAGDAAEPGTAEIGPAAE